MRPIPKCDLVPERLQGRPWWRYHEQMRCMVRKDGGVYGAQNEAEQATSDAEHPILAPPLRAGQVWLCETAGRFSTLLVGSEIVSGHSEFEILRTGNFGETRCYLLADPVDPDCAPWSAP